MKTLSELPLGETWKPVHVQVGPSPSRFSMASSILSPGRIRSVGGM